MIVVVIIGLLAALAIPALQRVQRATRDNRFLSDLRTLAQAFETYSLKNGAWPPNAGNGVVPAGMSGELRDSFWQQKNSLGGTWNWDFNNNGFTAGISIVNVTVDDDEMQAIDAKIDDGDHDDHDKQPAGRDQSDGAERHPQTNVDDQTGETLALRDSGLDALSGIGRAGDLDVVRRGRIVGRRSRGRIVG